MPIDKLEQLKNQRDEIFTKIGQYMLQKQYCEDKIKNLLIAQEDLCNKIFNLEKDISNVNN